MTSFDAVVVGAGPNGLAAAIELARNDKRVLLIEGHERTGGGTRTDELTLPGYRHDVCSTVYALAHASPFLRSLDLESHGVEWAHPDIPVAHVLDGETAALHRDLEETVEGLGADGPIYRKLVGPLVRRPRALYETVLGPVIRVPPHPIAAARFGLRGVRSAAGIARGFKTRAGRALIAGLGAHSIADLGNPLTGAMALVLAAAAHTEGYPFVRGGSEGISKALTAIFLEAGGEVQTGRWITSLSELPDSKVTMLDLAPDAAAQIAGPRLSRRTTRSLRRYRYGPGIFKVDYAVSRAVPWTDPVAARAGTVHVGGTLDEVVAWERGAWRTRPAGNPFLILTQPAIADPTRTPDDGHIVWAYAHVPNAWQGDLTSAITAQIERFAPGFADSVTDLHVTGPAATAAYNPNNVGGDIGGGAFGIRQIVARPRLAWNPYRLAGGVYLCSASTPPGGGVHGMSGYHAARRALAAM